MWAIGNPTMPVRHGGVGRRPYGPQAEPGYARSALITAFRTSWKPSAAFSQLGEIPELGNESPGQTDPALGYGVPQGAQQVGPHVLPNHECQHSLALCIKFHRAPVFFMTGAGGVDGVGRGVGHVFLLIYSRLLR